MSSLRLLLPVALAFVGVAVIDAGMVRRNLVPPRFRTFGGSSAGRDWQPVLRRVLAAGVLAVVLYLGVMAPLGLLGANVPELQASDPHVAQLFMLHGVFAASLLAWFCLGFLPCSDAGGALSRQFGLRAARVSRELSLGMIAGVGVWVVVILLLLLLSVLVTLLGGAELLPREPPGIVIWIGGLALWTRVAVSLSAGFFEEVFFRGFLQPRVGIILSTVFFAMAHLTYEQPFMLVGVTVLSLLFAWLVWWRQSIWAAVAAHAVFDLTQLVLVIPIVTRLLESSKEVPARLLGLL